MSAIRVGASVPLRACPPGSGGAPGMELGYMRDAVYRELSAALGLAASYWPVGEDGDMRAVTVIVLITLGSWVEEPETWDESLWGGSGTAWRRGRGHYEGMTDQELRQPPVLAVPAGAVPPVTMPVMPI